MKERPIIFSAPMVKAILGGRKTQTRRIVIHKRAFPPKWATFSQELSNIHWNSALDHKNGLFQWASAEDEGVKIVRRWPEDSNGSYSIPCPYGVVGDRLWVRETWMHGGNAAPDYARKYRADDLVISGLGDFEGERWIPAIHMFRWASRITLEITEVRVQRVQDISEEDAVAEGVNPLVDAQTHVIPDGHKLAFPILWDSINGKKHPWSSNPFVWAISFRRLQSEAKNR